MSFGHAILFWLAREVAQIGVGLGVILIVLAIWLAWNWRRFR